MGFLKSVGKFFKNVFKGVGRFFSKVWKSGIGKAIIIAAAIYFTAGAAGMAAGLGGGSFTAAASAQLGSWGGAIAGAAKSALGISSAASGTAGAAGTAAAAGTASTAAASGAGIVGPAAAAAAPTAALVAPAATSAGGSILSGLGSLSTGSGLIGSAILSAGAKMLEASNTPSAAEEESDKLKALQNANDISGITAHTGGPRPNYDATQTVKPVVPQIAVPEVINFNPRPLSARPSYSQNDDSYMHRILAERDSQSYGQS